jgi:uncharacterized membrane protein
MSPGRLSAFSDGVIAVLITIMVLDLPQPDGSNFESLRSLVPKVLVYLLSFVFLAIYWNNHHHLFHIVERIDGAVMWANMHLLFWLSLTPAATAWMGEHYEATAPVVIYGAILTGSAVAYYILTVALLRVHDRSSNLASAFGADVKGKLSIIAYVLAIPLAFVATWIAIAIYVGVAIVWLVPDRRVLRVLGAAGGAS